MFWKPKLGGGMNNLQTFKLWLEPDRGIPQFQRLRWATVDVSIQDVLLNGVHPWWGPDKHNTVGDAVLTIINEESALIPDLVQFGYSNEINVFSDHSWKKTSRFERVLEVINGGTYFVDDLSYLELLNTAREMLRDQWTHSTVREMLRTTYPGFQELRQFLKSKDGRIRLSSREDIDQYNLATVLTLDDFTQRDNVIISHAIPILNFRRASFLNRVTDEEGRLRLVPEIRHVTLTETNLTPGYDPLVWRVAREGSMWRFQPDIRDARTKRQDAQEFATRWRTDDGRLCFTTSIEKLAEMVECNAVQPSFPTLVYNTVGHDPTAFTMVDASNVTAFHIGRYMQAGTRGEHLKDILHEYGVSMTGNKDKLIEKLAMLAAVKYRERLPDMDGFFSRQRFVRMRHTPSTVVELPILDDLTNLRNLVLTMYALKHLRGDAILEASHENSTYTEDELALALLTGKVSLNGAFLRVA
jgi:hypothetical protein